MLIFEPVPGWQVVFVSKVECDFCGSMFDIFFLLVVDNKWVTKFEDGVGDLGSNENCHWVSCFFVIHCSKCEF